MKLQWQVTPAPLLWRCKLVTGEQLSLELDALVATEEALGRVCGALSMVLDLLGDLC